MGALRTVPAALFLNREAYRVPFGKRKAGGGFFDS